MTLLRAYLLFALVVISVYTLTVIAQDGPDLFTPFFGDMSAIGWPGQFNLDFMFMLSFSAIWTAWRNGFTPGGLGLAVLAFFFGAPFLAIYMTVLSFQTGGDVRAMLLGPTRA